MQSTISYDCSTINRILKGFIMSINFVNIQGGASPGNSAVGNPGSTAGSNPGTSVGTNSGADAGASGDALFHKGIDDATNKATTQKLAGEFNVPEGPLAAAITKLRAAVEPKDANDRPTPPDADAVSKAVDGVAEALMPGKTAATAQPADKSGKTEESPAANGTDGAVQGTGSEAKGTQGAGQGGCSEAKGSNGSVQGSGSEAKGTNGHDHAERSEAKGAHGHHHRKHHHKSEAKSANGQPPGADSTPASKSGGGNATSGATPAADAGSTSASQKASTDALYSKLEGLLTKLGIPPGDAERVVAQLKEKLSASSGAQGGASTTPDSCAGAGANDSSAATPKTGGSTTGTPGAGGTTPTSQPTTATPGTAGTTTATTDTTTKDQHGADHGMFLSVGGADGIVMKMG